MCMMVFFLLVALSACADLTLGWKTHDSVGYEYPPLGHYRCFDTDYEFLDYGFVSKFAGLCTGGTNVLGQFNWLLFVKEGSEYKRHEYTDFIAQYPDISSKCGSEVYGERTSEQAKCLEPGIFKFCLEANSDSVNVPLAYDSTNLVDAYDFSTEDGKAWLKVDFSIMTKTPRPTPVLYQEITYYDHTVCLPHRSFGYQCSLTKFICRCKEGWNHNSDWNPVCSINRCPGTICETDWVHYKCSYDNPDFVCVCNDGWTGDDCLNSLCNPPCETHGTCDNDGNCACDQGWSGPLCEIGNEDDTGDTSITGASDTGDTSITGAMTKNFASFGLFLIIFVLLIV